ncbi:PRC-barrel domain-containing protein [Arsenicitalea aurantiaca]|nr:PRC-barrel domain-containing protein [Arsenicitalea aurantiaca]
MSELERAGLRPPLQVQSGYTYSTEDRRVTEILGQPVYTSVEETGENIGSINEIIVTPDASIAAVVVEIGGFLGIGARNIAIEYRNLQYQVAHDGSWRWVYPTTAEQLQDAPEFVWTETLAEPGQSRETDGPVPIDETAMPDAPAVETANPNDDGSIAADQLRGATLYSTNNQVVGMISDVLVSDVGTVQDVIVDVGGFLGIGTRSVAVPYGQLRLELDANGNSFMVVDATREAIEALPEYQPQ